MKRFRFREQSLLQLRQQEKLAAEVVVMQANRDVRELEDQIDDLQEWLYEAMHQLTTTSPTADRSSRDAKNLLSIRAIQNGQHQLAKNNELLAAAKIRREQTLQTLREAEVAVKTLEQIKQERLVAHKRSCQTRQQQLSDEATMRMWMNAQQEVTLHD